MDLVARSRSLPPVQPNLFWSSRAQGKLELRVRPVDLPVPLDLEMDGEAMVREGRGRANSRDGRRSRELVVDREEEEATERRIFRTPASWASQREPLGEGPAMGPRTSGLMPMEEMAMDQEVKSTEGPFQGRQLVQDQLERDLEKEVVKSLHEENLRLKRRLQAMEERQNTSGSGWSEVTADTPRGQEEGWDPVGSWCDGPQMAQECQMVRHTGRKMSRLCFQNGHSSGMSEQNVMWR